MKALRPLLVVLALLAAAWRLTPLRAGEDDIQVASLKLPPEASLPYWPGEVVVQFRGGADDALMERGIRVVGAERARRSAFGKRYLVTLPEGLSVATAIDHFHSLPEVEYAEPNGMMRAFQARFTPNDTLYNLQWHLRLLDAERTWGIQRGDSSVVI